MKMLLVLLNLLSFATFCSANALELEKYNSVVVVGHLFPIYKIYTKKGNYTNSNNLKILSKSLNSLSNVSRLILLGDTYIDDTKKTYALVKKDLLDLLEFPFIKINGNHETMNIKRFNQSGGVSRNYIDVGNFRFIMFSPWVLKGNTLEMRISDSDVDFFKTSLSSKKKNIILITDMVHHKNARLLRWYKDVVPILKKFNVNYVVVGDNDRVQHRYSWVKLDDIYYIHQGIANNSIEPGVNTYLEIRLYHDGNIKFIPHMIPFDGLSDVYRMEDNEFKIKSKKINLDFSRWRELLRLAYSMFIN
jgi:hypothetical protein